MKIICKQCHQEFELTDSEIKFFTSQNLNIPKRCKRCREINRKINNSDNCQYDSSEAKIINYKTIIIILCLIIVAILIVSVTAISVLSPEDKPSNSKSDTLSVVTHTQQTTSSTQTKPILSTTKTTYTTTQQITSTTQTTYTTTQQITSTTQVQQITYYLNTYRHKFHRPDCDSVQQMNYRNRKAFYGTREEAVSMGYSPCHNCNP